jgi:hypothetical protein
MATIVYLDVEDEITTAAARIRNAGEPRVGMVVPYGSRVATARINFRLLAREALDAGRRLDIVAPDASARALAASAGLAVFASVGEYEAALATGEDETPGPEPEPEPAPASPRGKSKGVRGAAAAAGAVAAAGAADAARGAARPEQLPLLDDAATRGRPIAASSRSAAAATPVLRDLPADESTPRRRSRRGLVVFLVLLLAIVLGFGGAAAVMLPSAEIIVTPVMEAVTPVSLTVRADTTVTEVDPVGLVIPATSIDVPLTAQGEFAVTGTNVVQTSASGQVTFDSINTVNAMPVPRGTRVATSDGVGFVTTASVIVPRATVNGNTIAHGRVSVGVAAASAGTKGNVGAGAIDQVPSSLASQQISVSNGAATSGGARSETPKIVTADVTAATDKLTQDLNDQVPTAVADPTIAPAGATLYPDTAKLGAITYTPETAGLDGKVLKASQTTFTLQADATATVIAVDESPLSGLGESAIRAAVKSGDQIVEDSIAVEVSQGTVGEDGTVSYTITATALQHHPLDANALKTSVLGKTADEATAALAPYGKVTISLWPFWVSAVPTNADKVTLTVGSPEKPAPTPTIRPTPTPRPATTPRPTRAPASGKPASPSPSESAPDASPVPSA